jgi:adenine-specific DNA-methyltransferase
VQCIFIDPPYGVKFGSNFQPFVRKRDVAHGDDADMTREPEMVQAYRDTWQLGLHSYLTYLRDRLMVARDLLAPSGSVFVQISDENMHRVRDVLGEVFGDSNFVSIIPFVTTSSQTASSIGSIADYILWFAKDVERLKYRQLYLSKDAKASGGWAFNFVQLPDGTRRPTTLEERRGTVGLPDGSRLFQLDNITSQGPTSSGTVDFPFSGRSYHPGTKNHWKTSLNGMHNLANHNRIFASESQIRYVRFFDDFPVQPLTNIWNDTKVAVSSRWRASASGTLDVSIVIQRLAARRWCAAINATEKFGTWEYLLARRVGDVKVWLDAVAAKAVAPT